VSSTRAIRIHLVVLILLGCLLRAGALPAQPAPLLELQPGVSAHDLSAHVHYLHDPDLRLEPAAVLDPAAGARFRPLPGGTATFGFQPGAFWFHVRLLNRDPGEVRRVLVQQYALSDHVDLYLRRGDGAIEHQASGDALPFDARSIRYRHPNFLVELPAGEPVDVLVRVRSESSMQVPLALFTPTAFTESARDAQLGIGLYYGILLALFFYNLILWAVLRDASYFWYMFHIAGFGLVLFCLNGLAFEYLWPNSPWLQSIAVPVSICIAQIGMQQFARHFLDLRQRWRVGDRVALGLIVFFVALGLASFLLPYRIATPLASAAVFPSVIWIVIATVVVRRRGYAPAGLFLLAWAMFLLGTAAFTMVAFGVLPKMFLTEYGVQIGSALEMILLSFALAYRYAALRNENERIVRDANEQLEHSVVARTSELSAALEQLAQANTQLSESNRRDRLTGVYTRHHFRELLEDQLRDAREGRRQLAVLMIDLDHFKMINDRLGHLAGDDCLRTVARIMSAEVSARGGVLARFGGEEFVAALPGHSAEQAMTVAESMRQRVASEPAFVDGKPVAMTVSIGVHALDTYRIAGPDDALRLADAALYSAKNQGRNCVRPVQLA
jgi:diguanylate cyclase (GGDEF)-like protein